jgi:hypothetical protein
MQQLSGSGHYWTPARMLRDSRRSSSRWKESIINQAEELLLQQLLWGCPELSRLLALAPAGVKLKQQQLWLMA